MPPTLQLQTYTTTTTTTTTFMTDTTDIAPVVTTMAAEMKPSLAHELARELSLCCPSPDKEMDTVATYHNHEVGSNQCCSVVVQRIAAPIETVWALVRRFDQPQTYKHFLRSCRVIAGDGCEVGCLREVHVVSGLPAYCSTERLEVLDEQKHAIGFRVVGGEHRLHNYRSVTTLHPSSYSSSTTDGAGGGGGGREDNGGETTTTTDSPTSGCKGTVVVESYVVDVPSGNTKEETCVFVDTIVRCNLQSLSKIAERIARSSCTTPTTPSSSSSCKVS
ncbi:abscisic acid receptor PYL4-like [Spinacia oleracea]|uniref:Abscisic acid receptor PYL4-like n=1 Tax=Spinacia oleracea TaxID=3562 RepID=A0A9R0K2A7_SPIOL|nr:abscisic acid receptor PYL4-like [Spinacia oleracea]